MDGPNEIARLGKANSTRVLPLVSTRADVAFWRNHDALRIMRQPVVLSLSADLRSCVRESSKGVTPLDARQLGRLAQ
jgi:hypothetical protein